MNPFCACVRCKAHRAVHHVSDARLMALGGFWAARIWVRDFLIHVPAPEQTYPVVTEHVTYPGCCKGSAVDCACARFVAAR